MSQSEHKHCQFTDVGITGEATSRITSSRKHPTPLSTASCSSTQMTYALGHHMTPVSWAVLPTNTNGLPQSWATFHSKLQDDSYCNNDLRSNLRGRIVSPGLSLSQESPLTRSCDAISEQASEIDACLWIGAWLRSRQLMGR